MADEQRKVDISFKFKRDGDEAVLSSFKKIQESITSQKDRFAALRQEAVQVRSEINKLDDKAIKELVENTDRARKIAQQTQLEYSQLAGEIRGAANAADTLGTATQKAKVDKGGGGGSTNIGTIGRGLTGVGLGDAGQLLNTVDDLKDIYEQFKNIGGVSGAVASGTTAAAGGLTATLTAVLPIASVAIAGSLALKVLTDTIAAQKKAVDDVVAGLKADTDARLSQIEVIKNSSSEQIKNTLEVQKAQLAQVQADKASREAFLADIQRQYTELGNSFDPARRAALGQAGQVAEQSLTDLTNRENELTKAIEANTNKILPAIEAREKESKATEQATENTKNFAAELKRYSDLQQQLKEASTAVTAAEDDRKKAIQKRAQDDLRAAQVSQLESQIEIAKAKEAVQARKDRIAALRSESGQAEVEVAAKTQKSINDTNQKFMEQGLKSLNRYLLTEQRATDNYNVNRVRKLEDLYASLSELAAKGDVAAFVTTRRSGLRDVKRGDEDFGTGAQQRLQDYQNERREALQNRNQQIADARAAGQAELVDRKAQIAEKIKLEQNAGEQQLSQSQILQQQLANMRQQFARQDLAERRRSEDEAYRVQIGKLRERQNAITQTLANTFNPAVSSIYNLGNSVISFINRIRQAATAPVQRLTGSAGQDLKAGRNYITAYSGGTPRVPVSGVYHLDAEEAVLNRREAAAYRSNRMPGFAGAGRSLTVIVNATVGELVTTSHLNQQIKEMTAGISLAVNGGSTT